MNVEPVAVLLRERKVTVATAESCTGGLLAKMLTDVPGSSRYFVEGVVAYSNAAKTRLLGVSESLLGQHGAVSEPAAVAMALGCRVRGGTDYAVAITGIAGPGGGTADKPVGLVHVAVADAEGCRVKTLRVPGTPSRGEVRRQAAHFALSMLHDRLQSAAPDP